MNNHEILINYYKELNLEINEDGYYSFYNNRYVIIPMRNAHCIFLNLITDLPDKMELLKGYETLDDFIELYNVLTK